MTGEQLTGLRETLLRLREETLAGGRAKIEPNRKDPSQVGVADEDEQALSEMLQTLASEHNKKQAHLLSRIAAALQRLDSAPDEFGLCEDCEEEIPHKRLQLMPYATLCAECQASLDPRRGESRKSLTDYR